MLPIDNYLMNRAEARARRHASLCVNPLLCSFLLTQKLLSGGPCYSMSIVQSCNGCVRARRTKNEKITPSLVQAQAHCLEKCFSFIPSTGPKKEPVARRTRSKDRHNRVASFSRARRSHDAGKHANVTTVFFSNPQLRLCFLFRVHTHPTYATSDRPDRPSRTTPEPSHDRPVRVQRRTYYTLRKSLPCSSAMRKQNKRWRRRCASC